MNRPLQSKEPLVKMALLQDTTLLDTEGDSMVNRSAVILKYKTPIVEWINDTDPREDFPELNLEEANREKTIYLISEHDAENLDRWLKMNFKSLFESELENWYLDDCMWPKKRTMKVFQGWFDVECHTVIIDTVGTPIEDDEA